MDQPREHFSADLDAAQLAELKALAEAEGRELRVLVDEAIAGLLAQKRAPEAQPGVAELLDQSILKYDKLYRKLAE